MPTVYVTYRDPHTASPVTVAVETALSFRVFRAAALVEGVLLPGERAAVLPAALLLVSLDPPPGPMQAERLPAAGTAAAQLAGPLVALPPNVVILPGPTATNPLPEPPAAAPAGGGAAATRQSRERRRR